MTGRSSRPGGTPPRTEHRELSTWRVVATAAGALIVGTFPMFLLGALSPRIGADLEIGGAAVGLLVAVFFAAGAASSIPAGYVTDRIGSTAALRVAATIAAASSAGVALFGVGVVPLIILFLVGGTAVAMADTGGARAIAATIPHARQGLAFGGKEASIPAASMLAGLTVPVLGAQFGWRPAYAVAAGLAVLFFVAVPRGLGPVPPRPVEARHGERSEAAVTDGTNDHVEPDSRSPHHDHGAAAGVHPVLVLLAIAAGLGGGAATATPTFLVPSATAGGLSESAAGLLLAGASIVGIGMRLSVGLVADRRLGGEIRLAVVMLAVGTVGLAVLSVGGTALTVVGAVLALGGGWGWTGLLFLAAVRTQPARPAAAAGTVLAGLATGGALGPAVFGWLAERPGYATAWAVAAGSMLLACGLGLAADHRRRLT